VPIFRLPAAGILADHVIHGVGVFTMQKITLQLSIFENAKLGMRYLFRQKKRLPG
jgi:hypothetical protein